MSTARRVIPLAIRALATTLVAAASLQLALHVAHEIFRTRHGLDGGAAIPAALGCLAAIGIGVSTYHRSQAVGDRLLALVRPTHTPSTSPNARGTR